MANTISLKITGMSCEHCINHVTEELEALPGVEKTEVTLVKGGESSAVVTVDTDVDDDTLRETVDDAGGYVVTTIERH
ncbi:heavy-metal-associated domain-containing protein [Actinotignum urinale]|uniref:heavy-metal-associated domain-containing protein n=1 Tax=Actinotignum urinale TaxID=190146 RepID=UPI0003B315B9|nr:cation transporter [Actinotignum urinale]MDY5160612.1 cation transporter [Actinotignum urinale]